MSRFSRIEVFQKLLQIKMIPVFYHPSAEIGKGVTEACMRGGAQAVEFTHRADRAQEVFAEVQGFHHRENTELLLGVGSIVEEATAAHYINLGADFVVSPCFNEGIARLCNRRKIAYMPGCGTATEISHAEEWGAEICKVFPGNCVGGPAFIQAIMGPMPWSRLMPTGGVDNTAASISSWLKAGAACLGMGSKLVSHELMEAKDYATIETNVRQAICYVRDACKDLSTGR